MTRPGRRSKTDRRSKIVFDLALTSAEDAITRMREGDDLETAMNELEEAVEAIREYIDHDQY